MRNFSVGEKVKVRVYVHERDGYITGHDEVNDTYTVQLVGGPEQYFSGHQVREATLPWEEYIADVLEREKARREAQR